MNFLFLKSDIPFNPYSKKVKKKGGGGVGGKMGINNFLSIVSAFLLVDLILNQF